jgi:hypothetical protein
MTAPGEDSLTPAARMSEVADALADAADAEGGRFGQRHHRHAVDVVDACLDEVGNENIRHEIDRDSRVAQGIEQLQGARLRGHGEGDVDEVDAVAVDVVGYPAQRPEQFFGVDQFGALDGAVVEEADHVDAQRAVVGKAAAQLGAEMPRADDDGAAAPAFQHQQTRQDPAHDAVRQPHGNGGNEHPGHDEAGRKPVQIAAGVAEQQDQPGQEEPGHDDLVPEGTQGDFGPFAGEGQGEDDQRQDGVRPAEGFAEIQRAADQHQHGHKGVEQDLGQRYDGKLLPEQPLIVVCHHSCAPRRCAFITACGQACYRFWPGGRSIQGFESLCYKTA